MQKKISIFSLLLLFVVGAGTLWFWFFNKVDFIISNVPFITVYNHTGKNTLITNSTAASLISVLEYYGNNFSDADYQKINSIFSDPNNQNETGRIEYIQSAAEPLGYNIKVETFRSLKDLKRYISPRSKIPLIFGHLLTADQDPKKIDQTPRGVLIGVLEKENAVVVHDYYWGYNKQIGWEDFKKIANTHYLVIQPKSSDNLGNKKVSYPEQTASMDKAVPLIGKIVLGQIANKQKQYEDALDYYQNTINDTNFDENVPPYYKVIAYYGIAISSLQVEKDPNKALGYALKATDLNHDLDKPFSDYWLGYENGTNTISNKFSSSSLGIIYVANKEFDLAKGAYQDALNINGDNVQARNALLKLNNR